MLIVPVTPIIVAALVVAVVVDDIALFISSYEVVEVVTTPLPFGGRYNST